MEQTNEPEWKTRKERIDKRLAALPQPWTIIKYKEGLDTASLAAHAVAEYPTENGPADYALFVQGQFLGIIEAKKVSIGAQNVLEQAKRYSRGASDGPGNWHGFRVPFLYSTNGEIVYFIDVRPEQSYSRQISDFHTPEALLEMAGRESDYSWFEENPCAIERLRPYQQTAITNAERAIVKGKRSMLLAMATGTGKTFTTVSLIYRLLESKKFKRILFLVDRRALAAQAVREFSSFTTPSGNKFDQEYEVYSQRFRREDLEDEDSGQSFNPKVLPEEYLTKPNARKTFVYVSTIQRMTINLLGNQFALPQSEGDNETEDDAGKLDIPIHAFDVIIADECHRGYSAGEAAIWRKVIEHFDCIRIGLTATPAAHTMAIFHEIVSRYTMEEAIAEGYLVDYDVVKIRSGVRMQGAFLKEGELVGLRDTGTGTEQLDKLEDEREFDASEVERKITVPDCNRKIVKEIAGYARQHEAEYGRFPKILIFADNDLDHISHADELVKMCREEFGQGDDFVQKITGKPNVDRPLQKIRMFRNRPNPKIVVTVDMLSTGVDIPALEFIVFLRPVKSRILWVQMLGRGTRRCAEINKEKFVIFDCFDGTLLDYFKNATDFDVMQAQKEPVPLKKVIENIYNNIDRPYYTKVLVRRLHRVARTMSGEAREQFAAWIHDGDVAKFAIELPKKLENDFLATMKILRDENFQDLVLNYPRAKPEFVVGYSVQDEVSSEKLFRVGEDSFPVYDYLDTFTQWVKNNQDQIDALKILMASPRKWRTEALEELRAELTKNRFRLVDLQKAHGIAYQKPLADIISMIKHAARKEEPVFNVEERVARALGKVTQGKSFTDEQQVWLGYIREHLIQNLTIELDDFDMMPVFSNRGGRGKAAKVFGPELQSLVEDLNYAIAA